MKPISFKGQTTEIAKNQKEYITLPALVLKDDEGTVIFCIKMNLWERVWLLFTGKLWCAFLMFGKDMTPSKFSVRRSDFFIIEKVK